MKKNAFTLVEIMIVVAIIGILAAIAIPNLAASRERSQQKACIANLKQIEGAKETWAAFANKPDGTTVSIASLVTSKDLKSTPTCPGGGTYAPGVTGAVPTCTLGTTKGHSIPAS